MLNGRSFILRIHWRLSTILKTSNKSVWNNFFFVFFVCFFWYVKVYIFWKFIQYTIHWDKTQILQKSPSEKINVTKNPLFFFRELQLITILLLIRNSYTSRSTWFISLKQCVGFSITESVLFLLKFTFLFNKKHGLFDFETS